MGMDWYMPHLASYDLNNPGLGFLIFVATLHHPIHCVPLHFQSVTYHLSFGALCYTFLYIHDKNFKVSYIKSHVHKYPFWFQGTVS